MKDEITWERIRQESGYPHDITEMTSVTNKVRRVGRFDWDLARKAISVNRPTKLAINGLDYLDYRNFGIGQSEQLSEFAKQFIRDVERRLGMGIEFLGVGPALRQIIRGDEWQESRQVEHGELVLP